VPVGAYPAFAAPRARRGMTRFDAGFHSSVDEIGLPLRLRRGIEGDASEASVGVAPAGAHAALAALAAARAHEGLIRLDEEMIGIVFYNGLLR